jgi:hypothetical protein
MTLVIHDTAPRRQYTAEAGQTVFAVPFEFFANADLKVYHFDTLLGLATTPADASHYSVVGAGITGGGHITLGAPGAVQGDIITIVRDIPTDRITDFPLTGPFNIEALNTELDRIVVMIQEVEAKLDQRALMIPEWDAPASMNDIPPLPGRASTVLGFDTEGQPMVAPISQFSPVAAVSQRREIIATEGQTSFQTAATYTLGYIGVYVNGVRLSVQEFTASDGTNVVLHEPARAGDVVLLEGFLGSAVAGDASAILFIQAGAGAVERTAQNKLRERISIMDYGFVFGDSNEALNNRTRIINAIAEAAARGGGVIHFPGNTAQAFVGGGNIDITTSSVVLQGAGISSIHDVSATGDLTTALRFTTANTRFRFFTPPSAGAYVRGDVGMKGFILIGNGMAARGLEITSIRSPDFEVLVTGFIGTEAVLVSAGALGVDAGEPCDTQRGKIVVHSRLIDSAGEQTCAGIKLDGSGGNVSMTAELFAFGYHHSAPVIDIANADNIEVSLIAYRAGGGTGRPFIAHGRPAGLPSGAFARAIRFKFLSGSVAGLVEGTENPAVDLGANVRIDWLDKENNTPMPDVGIGASCWAQDHVGRVYAKGGAQDFTDGIGFIADRPPATFFNRGTRWFEWSGAGVVDKEWQVRKDVADNYVWVDIT